MSEYWWIDTAEGLFGISERIVKLIAYDEAYYRSKYFESRLVEEDHGTGLPKIKYYRYDYKKAYAAGRKAVEGAATGAVDLYKEGVENYYAGRNNGLSIRLRDFREELADREAKARRYKRKITEQGKKASSESMRNIQGTISHWETAKLVAELTRDVSADVFIAGAGVLSGGAAYAALGGGSIAKGVFKYQDTGDVGTAIAEGGTTFAVGLIPGGKIAAKLENKAVAYLLTETPDVAASAFVAWVDPKENVGTAAVTAVGGKAFGQAAKRLKVDDLHKMGGLFDDVGMPAKFKFSIDGKATAKLIAHNTVVNGGKVATKWTVEKLTERRKSGSRRPLPIAETWLADLAVIGPDVSRPVLRRSA
jgi:hypothetical protein